MNTTKYDRLAAFFAIIWEHTDNYEIESCDIATWALKLELVQEVNYDPAKHNISDELDYIEEGDTISMLSIHGREANKRGREVWNEKEKDK